MSGFWISLVSIVSGLVVWAETRPHSLALAILTTLALMTALGVLDERSKRRRRRRRAEAQVEHMRLQAEMTAEALQPSRTRRSYEDELQRISESQN